MLRSLLLTGILSFICLAAFTQSANWYATSNASTITTKSVFEVRFVLENAKGAGFQPPEFSCFDFISGPAQSSSISIINGRRSESMSYTYTLMRTRPGTCTIGPATIRVGSRDMKTEPITIKVVEGKAGGGSADPAADHDVFLEAEITDKPVYPGQQVRLDYKVYTTVNVRNYNTLKEDDYDQFYYRYIQEFNNRAQSEVIDGVQYTTQKIKSLALFPQQTGTFTIEPMIATLGLTVRNERPSFLFGARTIPVTVSTDSLTLKVLPLPPGAPSSFTGAVGKYFMNATINQRQFTTDDAIVLRLDIQGDGDPKRWSAPALDSLRSEYEIYDPRIISDESSDRGGEIRHRRVIEYLLVPRQPGAKTLQLDFSYFDPDSAVYRTLHSTPFAISVTQGSRKGPGENVYSADAASRQIQGLKPWKRGSGILFIFSPLYFILLALPLAGLGLIWYRKREELAFAALDPAEKKRRRARKIAEKHLSGAREHMQGSEKEYYDSLSRAIFSYISAKLNIRASEISKSNIASQLEKLNLPEELRNETMQILTTSEQVLYAGGTSQADRQQMYDRALELMGAIEERF